VEDRLDREGDVAVVDAGDGLAEADGSPVSEAGRQSEHPALEPELGSLPPSGALMADSQSIAAVPVPWQMKPPKSSRASQVPWAMISPAAASSV
jgi:hypothetical protein